MSLWRQQCMIFGKSCAKQKQRWTISWWLNRDVNKQIGKSQSTGQEIMNAKFVNQAPNIELLGVRQSVAAPLKSIESLFWCKKTLEKGLNRVTGNFFQFLAALVVFDGAVQFCSLGPVHRKFCRQILDTKYDLLNIDSYPRYLDT